MNFFRKRKRLKKQGWPEQVLLMAQNYNSAKELCQRVAEEIGKPIYPIENLEVPSCGKFIENEDYFLIFYQPAPLLVSEMTILHELTHILFEKSNLFLGDEAGVERFAFELFLRIYPMNKLFSPQKNSSVVSRYESLLS